MSLSSKRALIGKMFKYQSKVAWAHTDAEAKEAFEMLMKLRDEYRKSGGEFKKNKGLSETLSCYCKIEMGVAPSQTEVTLPFRLCFPL